MSIVDDAFQVVYTNKERSESGKINCIPFAFRRMRFIYPGIEKASVIISTGASKAGKSNLMTFIGVINTVLYSYYHKDELRFHIIYFSMEELKTDIILRFTAHLIFRFYGKRVTISDLKSLQKGYPVSDEIIKMMNDPRILDILRYFESHCDLYEDIDRVIDMDKIVRKYAESHGRNIYSDKTFIDESGVERHTIDHYEPDDPEEYVIVIADHVGLLSPNKNEMNLFNAIKAWTKNCVKYKNNYKYISINVQQQVDAEINSVSAKQNGMYYASKSGLKDNKETGNDSTQMFGITDLCVNHLNDVQTPYDDYRRIFNGHFRVIELLYNRFGEANVRVPVFFDGAISYMEELPSVYDADNPVIKRLIGVYDMIRKDDEIKRQRNDEIMRQDDAAAALTNSIQLLNLSTKI